MQKHFKSINNNIIIVPQHTILRIVTILKMDKDDAKNNEKSINHNKSQHDHSGLSTSSLQSPDRKKKKTNKDSSSNSSHNQSSANHALGASSAMNIVSSNPMDGPGPINHDCDVDQKHDEVSKGSESENDDGESNVSDYGPHTKSSNFPYGEDPTVIQLELIEISLLILIAKACKFVITTQSNQQQSRQRKDFISNYDKCNEELGYKYLANVFMLHHRSKNEVQAVLYVEPTAESKRVIKESDLIFTERESKVIYEIAGHNTIIQMSANLDLQVYREAIVFQLNQQNSANTAAVNTNMSVSCIESHISFPITYNSSSTDNQYGCNQILTMVTAQRRATNESIVPDINNKTTVVKVIEFFLEIENTMRINHPALDAHDVTHYDITLNKVVMITETCQAHLSELTNPTSADYTFLGLQPKHMFHPIHIQQLLVGASHLLLFRFYRIVEDAPSFNKKFSLVSINPLDVINRAYHTMSEATKALELGIVCCERTSNGNILGNMWTMKKDNFTTEKIKTIVDNLNKQSSKIISHLAIINPFMVSQLLQKKDDSRQSTSALMDSNTFQYVHISGIPVKLFEDKPNLHLFLFKSKGVLELLYIQHPQLYDVNNIITGYEVQALNISQAPYHYIPFTKSIVLKLKYSYTHHISMRSIQALAMIGNKTTKVNVLGTFINQSQLDIILRGSEVLSVRPIQHQHVSQVAKLVFEHFQRKTQNSLVILSVPLESKSILSKTKKHITVNEVALVIISEVADDNLSALRLRLDVPYPCPINATILFQETLRLQVENGSKQFAYKGYPQIMKGDSTFKYCIVHNVAVNTSPSIFLEEYQKNVSIGHCIKYVYILPLTDYSMDLIVAIAHDNMNPRDITNNITTSLKKLKWYNESETSIELLTSHPSSEYINTSVVIEIKHPEVAQSSWSTQAPKKVKSAKSKSTIKSNGSNSNSSATKKTTIADFFKPHSATDTSAPSAIQE